MGAYHCLVDPSVDLIHSTDPGIPTMLWLFIFLYFDITLVIHGIVKRTKIKQQFYPNSVLVSFKIF